ncbi:MAG: hypothetical protein A2070_06460 [Bdellovibrionales bacterium GWC1_52_8]|nr:MAG: hypothetical protein A2Z97_03270 [Bdellovibrionales bacterium GWB1_52_6]OFZ02893.1 MAG: hypothetical protein A2X97_04795 [Bdellovibrionales bacterium GWA1_52_35]OFZ44021.1 MAG: hypothetical protein A2070_06460 [Bdellovibrionales bacterium GWC1_52_8]HCM38476.1 hypothetical protein [Bdellovibrionales bacterium]
MEKIALIYRSHLSDWTSCRSITRNLAQAYRLAFPKAEFRDIFCEAQVNPYVAIQTARTVSEFAPDLLVFIDHSPFPGTLLQALSQNIPKPPRIFVHVFGDFTLHAVQWVGCEQVLKALDVTFFCASEKQRQLIGSFVQGGAAQIRIAPFPVSTQEFRPSSSQARAGFRKQAGVPAGDLVFLYTGRLSLQKNLILLIRSFGAYLRQIDPRAQLWLAGPMDDLGVPYLGKRCLSGTFSSDLLEAIRKTIPPEASRQVRYFGDLQTEMLVQIYGAADFFISLSTHNDEDFGMAPAEAACCGLPLILSDWGGYSSFSGVGTDAGLVARVPVRIEEKRVSPAFEGCVQAMIGMAAQAEKGFSRETLAKRAAEYLSISSVAGVLKSEQQGRRDTKQRFSGFSPLFRQVAQAFEAYPDSPFRSGTGYSALYRKVYEKYL